MAPMHSCVCGCVFTETFMEACKEMWFLHHMLDLGKKYQTKAVSVERYFYSYIISPVNVISSKGVSSGTWRL